MEKIFGSITIHCPYCGKELILDDVTNNVDEEHFEDEVKCQCKNNYKIEYDIPMGRVKILANIYLK